MRDWTSWKRCLKKKKKKKILSILQFWSFWYLLCRHVDLEARGCMKTPCHVFFHNTARENDYQHLITLCTYQYDKETSFLISKVNLHFSRSAYPKTMPQHTLTSLTSFLHPSHLNNHAPVCKPHQRISNTHAESPPSTPTTILS
jgi:hypothetical protein